MSETQLPPRPRQLMLAAGVVIGGSAFLVAAVFDSLAKLQSVDAREQLQEVISSSAGRELGVTLDQAVSAVQAALGLTAVCAAIALVLGIFVLQRHRGARIALTIVAVPLLVTAPLVGGFLGALVAVATMMLWNGPAGDWYAGRPIREGRDRGRRDSEKPSSPEFTTPAARPTDAGADQQQVAPPSTRATSTTPGATEGFGAPVPDPLTAPAPAPLDTLPPPDPTAVPLAPPLAPPAATPATSPYDAGAVPKPVRVACVLTWVFSGFVAALYLVAVVALLADQQAIVDRVVESSAWRDSGMSEDLLAPMLWFGVLLFLAWSLGAIVLAWFTWRRHDWARYVLTVSAGLTLLVGTIAFPVGLPHQLACAATIGALFGQQARDWFAGRPPRHRQP